MKRVVVTGNCLGQGFAVAFQEAAQISPGSLEFVFVPTHVEHDEQQIGSRDEYIIRHADIFFQQVDSTLVDPIEHLIPGSAKRFRYPSIKAPFLWPFATRSHPRCYSSRPHIWNPIFGHALSDGNLANIVETESDPERAFERYAAIDPLKQINVDRLFELTRNKMRESDLECDFPIWNTIEERFRSERILWGISYPTWALMWSVLKPALFAVDIGLDDSKATAIFNRVLPMRMWRGYEGPIHPRIADHFGLAWWHPGIRYQLDRDGWFTWEEYIRRYIEFRHDPRIYIGYYLSDQPDEEKRKGENELRSALADAPGNALVQYYLARNLCLQNRYADAIPCFEAATADEDVARDPSTHALHAEALSHLGSTSNAVEEVQRAIDLAPNHAPFHALLAKIHEASANPDKAFAAFAEATRLDPYDKTFWLDAARLAASLPACIDASPYFEAALSFAPANAFMLQRYAEYLLSGRRLEQAHAVAIRGVDCSQPKFGNWRVLASVLEALGRPQQAMEAWQAAIELNPKSPWAFMSLSRLHLDVNNAVEALACAEQAIVIDPSLVAALRQRDLALAALSRSTSDAIYDTVPNGTPPK